MKIIFALMSAAGMVLVACGTQKTTTATSPSAPVVVTKPANGIYPPGQEELDAMHLRDTGVTQAQLHEGYMLYAKGACIQCHSPKNIYVYSEPEWKNIVVSMSKEARLTLTQQQAVYNYVLAIKATQPANIPFNKQ